MPCITKTAYYKQEDNILDALQRQAKEETRKAGEQLQQHILDENLGKGENDIFDAAASFDST